MSLLFTEDCEILLKFSFDFFDCDNNGKISINDVSLILSYLPLKSSKYNFSYKFPYEHPSFSDQLKSKNEIYSITHNMFKKEEMNFSTFQLYTTKVDSSIFLYVLLTLYEFKPFSKQTLNYYAQITSINDDFISIKLRQSIEGNTLNKSNSKPIKNNFSNHNSSLSTSRKKLFPLPNINFSFEVIEYMCNSEYFKSFYPKDALEKVGIVNTEEESIPFSIQLMKSMQERKDEKKRRKTLKQLKQQLPFENLSFTSNDNTDTNKINKDNNLNKSTESNDNDIITSSKRGFNIFDINCKIYHEGSIYILNSNMYLISAFAKIIHTDLYIYNNEHSVNHKMRFQINLSYLKDNNLVQYENKQLYNIELIFPKKTVSIFTPDEAQYNSWLKYFKSIHQNKDIDLYDIKEKIGMGRYGLVRRAIHKLTKRKVAIKFVEKKNMTHQEMQLLCNEIEILKIIKHPNVVNLYDVIETVDICYIITEYIPGGDLHSFLEKKDYKLQESKVAFFIQQVCVALYYLNSYGIIHRDIKPEHVLIGESVDEPKAKLIDFGFAAFIFENEYKKDIYGTIGYISPEVLAGSLYDKSCDIWSIGIVFYLMMVSCLPFDDDHSEEEIKRMILNEQVPFPEQLWKKKSVEGGFFAENVLRKDPKQRLKLDNLLALPWFNKYIKSKIAIKRGTIKGEWKYWYYILNDEAQVDYYKKELLNNDTNKNLTF